MQIHFEKRVAEVFTRAVTGGVEISIAEMVELLALEAWSPLEAYGQIVDVVGEMGLELVPPTSTGDFKTMRVLRRAESSEIGMAVVQKALIAGEGPRVEYKSSMCCSVRDWTKSKELKEHPALAGEITKTLCAFLNSAGGDLLVGVDDSGVPCGGIELDLQLKNWTVDTWQQAAWNLINNRFYEPSQVGAYIRLNLVDMGSTLVAHFSVLQRTKPSFVRRDKAYEFFVRNGSRSDSLDYPGFYAHLIAGGYLTA